MKSAGGGLMSEPPHVGGCLFACHLSTESQPDTHSFSGLTNSADLKQMDVFGGSSREKERSELKPHTAEAR